LSKIDKKARKKVADKQYRERRSKDQEVKKKEEDSLKEKLEEIVVAKTEKAEQMSKYVENLKYEMHKIQKLKKEAIEKVIEKDVELMVLKEQFKALHKIHKSCAKDDH
jgi:Glu-tRNA(Gln) amidotransferase subunit E-like FAD-binding protein